LLRPNGREELTEVGSKHPKEDPFSELNFLERSRGGRWGRRKGGRRLRDGGEEKGGKDGDENWPKGKLKKLRHYGGGRAFTPAEKEK